MTDIIDQLAGSPSATPAGDNTPPKAKAKAKPKAKKKPVQYSDAFKQKAVLDVVGKNGMNNNAAAKKHGVPPVTLSRWVKAYKKVGTAPAANRASGASSKGAGRVAQPKQTVSADLTGMGETDTAVAASADTVERLNPRQLGLLTVHGNLASYAHEMNRSVIDMIPDSAVREFLHQQNDTMAMAVTKACRVHRSEIM